ncbi:hypothetical protein [Marinobacter sp. ELB17]|uniref:hypothetical protein n=1 Tax=Marinobacter sp. ELB17 TaxID=270374 RepID=UPI0000F3B374|nr:hypothetical protein [Marinobacter sp. ELB17]EAZ98359.1 hypothetical protein MELB17_09038 [Marinobacter sp. ELB17]
MVEDTPIEAPGRGAPVHMPKGMSGLGARVEVSLVHARLKPMQLRERLRTDFDIRVSRTNTYKLVNGDLQSTRYFMEVAEICGVSAKWLSTGKGYMIDMTGRLSTRDEAARDARRLLTQHVIPPNRNDIVRLHGRLITLIQKGALTPAVVRGIASALDVLTDDNA